MAGVSVRIVKNNLPAIAEQLPVTRRAILARRGEQMRDIAKNRSRVDTGEMRDGWNWTETNQGGRLQNDVNHVSFNEYGTRNMPSQAMARPAAEQVFPQIQEDFAKLEGFLK